MGAGREVTESKELTDLRGRSNEAISLSNELVAEQLAVD